MSFRRLTALLVLMSSITFSGGIIVAAEQAAPDFTLTALDGTRVSLSSLKGKVVFLDFWASWCPPCRMSIPAVEKLYEKYAGGNVVFLGINLESNAGAVRSFVQKMNMKYTVVMGNEKVSRAYGVTGIPAFYVISPGGTIAKRSVGYSPSMENEWSAEIDRLLPPKNTKKGSPAAH